MSIKDNFSSVRQERVSESTVKQVVRLVESGRLAEGTRLPSEREMMKLLGVSRNSYREAVRILETMGMLRVEAGRGTWVTCAAPRTALDTQSVWLAAHEQDLADLIEVRDLLEPKAAALAAVRATQDELDEISSEMNSIRRAGSAGDIDEILGADTAFHTAIARASGNRALMDVLVNLYSSLAESRRTMITRIPGRQRRQVEEHRGIAEAIVARDLEAAIRAMTQHTARAQEALKAFVHGQELLP